MRERQVRVSRIVGTARNNEEPLRVSEVSQQRRESLVAPFRPKGLLGSTNSLSDRSWIADAERGHAHLTHHRDSPAFGLRSSRATAEPTTSAATLTNNASRS